MKSYDLNEVQAAAERLLSLLKDRHPGLMTWNEALGNALKDIHATTGSEPEVKVVYIGGRFSQESGSRMSPVYLEDGSRYDYGFLQRDLRNGLEVTSRQATPEELSKYEAELATWKAKEALQ